MAKAISSDIQLGLKMPETTLPDVDGELLELQQCYGPSGLVVMFICSHCPFVRHIASFFPYLQERLAVLGIGTVAINSTDVEQFPDDGPACMVNFVAEFGLTFPYLFDETQAAARNFGAVCTPDFYLFDAGHRLVYHGQLDESRPGSACPTDGRHLLGAAELMTTGKPVPKNQAPSLGCSIKPRPC